MGRNEFGKIYKDRKKRKSSQIKTTLITLRIMNESTGESLKEDEKEQQEGS